jgi:hypothetical protein
MSLTNERQAMSKTVAILQSNYIPWKGYFDIINMVDEFILFDEVQYTRRDWRNRNLIKTPQGTQWLTIPVVAKGRYEQAIHETQVQDNRWVDEHWKAIHHNYARSPYFDQYAPAIKAVYDQVKDEALLSKINHAFIITICKILNITTKIIWSSSYKNTSGKTERLVSLCQQSSATCYLSGPAARNYLDETQFETAKIQVQYMSYDGYPEYRQRFPPFEHQVSILDLIFNEGKDASQYMKSFAV